MINANELRIGNWVQYSKEKWLKIKYDRWSAEDFESGIKPDPIPLTPEILKKAGLKRTGLWCDHIEFTDELYVSESGRIYYRYWEGSDDRGGLEDQEIAQIKYVHHLQNMYFALTGEELQIDL